MHFEIHQHCHCARVSTIYPTVLYLSHNQQIVLIWMIIQCNDQILCSPLSYNITDYLLFKKIILWKYLSISSKVFLINACCEGKVLFYTPIYFPSVNYLFLHFFFPTSVVLALNSAYCGLFLEKKRNEDHYVPFIQSANASNRQKCKNYVHIRVLISGDPEKNHSTCYPSVASHKDRKGCFPFIPFKETKAHAVRGSVIRGSNGLSCIVFSCHVMKWLMAEHRTCLPCSSH